MKKLLQIKQNIKRLKRKLIKKYIDLINKVAQILEKGFC